MKKELIAVIFFLSIFLVSAMSDPIKVKTSPGNTVKIYAWTAGSGPLLVMNEGTADEDGIFNTTFFSLNEPTVKFNIMVIDPSDEKIRDNKFDDQKTNKPYFFNCIPENCIISNENETTSVPTVNSTNENTANTSKTNATTENSTRKSFFTGNFIFKEDGSINYINAGIIILILFGLIFGISIFFRKNKKGDKVEKQTPSDPEDAELTEIESKIKERESELKKIRDEANKKQRIDDAKNKLAREENELVRLRNNRLEEAKRKLNSEENEIKRFQQPRQSFTPSRPQNSISQSAGQVQEVQKAKNVQNFVDNMRKFANDKNPINRNLGQNQNKDNSQNQQNP